MKAARMLPGFQQIARVLVVAIAVAWAFGFARDGAMQLSRCADFITQAEAQAHLSARFDRDSDGRACERLP